MLAVTPGTRWMRDARGIVKVKVFMMIWLSIVLSCRFIGMLCKLKESFFFFKLCASIGERRMVE